MSNSKKIPSKLTKGLPARKTPKFKGSLTDKGENQMKPVPDEQTQYPMPKWLKADSKKELKEFEEFLEISQLLETEGQMDEVSPLGFIGNMFGGKKAKVGGAHYERRKARDRASNIMRYGKDDSKLKHLEKDPNRPKKDGGAVKAAGYSFYPDGTILKNDSRNRPIIPIKNEIANLIKKRHALTEDVNEKKQLEEWLGIFTKGGQLIAKYGPKVWKGAKNLVKGATVSSKTGKISPVKTGLTAWGVHDVGDALFGSDEQPSDIDVAAQDAADAVGVGDEFYNSKDELNLIQKQNLINKAKKTQDAAANWQDLTAAAPYALGGAALIGGASALMGKKKKKKEKETAEESYHYNKVVRKK
jgi:hypothetical protein